MPTGDFIFQVTPANGGVCDRCGEKCTGLEIIDRAREGEPITLCWMCLGHGQRVIAGAVPADG